MSSDTLSYIGESKNGKPHGKGTLLHTNGDVYKGQFRDGLYHGDGILLHADGDVYKGEFRYGLLNGYGACIIGRAYVYTGGFKDGISHGNGVSSGAGIVYIGEFKEGERNGSGTLLLRNGDVYKGEFKANKSHGRATVTLADGNVYSGYFSDDIFYLESGETSTCLPKLSYHHVYTNSIYYLIFDTETTGLPIDWRAPVTNLENWPRLVQLAYSCYSHDGKHLYSEDFVIKPEGFSIPKNVTEIHGISTERALEEGRSLPTVLQQFSILVEKATFLVSHNMAFDEKVLGAEFIRTSMHNNIPSKNRICTMEISTNYCQIAGQYGYKWPNLSELHYKLFKTGFEEAHNAAVDIKATAECFWELKKIGVITS